MDERARPADPTDASDSADELRRAAAVGFALIRAKHDLNNLFHVARGWSRLLEDPRTGTPQAREGVDAVLIAAKHTSDLVNGVLALAGRVLPSGSLGNLQQELASLTFGLRYLVPAPDQLKVELGSRALVQCDFAELRRALLCAVLGTQGALGEDELLLRVTDDASGDTAASAADVVLTLERIPRRVSNDAAPQLLLSLRYPAASRAEAPDRAPPAAAEAGDEQSHSTTPHLVTSTVLLVDDHRDVRRLGTTLLEHAGYQVLTACDAEDALVTSQNYDGPIHLLCCDAQMPGPPVLRLIAELCAARRDLRVLVCTGERPQGQLAEFPHLAKPFSYQELVSAVRGCLE